MRSIDHRKDSFPKTAPILFNPTEEKIMLLVVQYVFVSLFKEKEKKQANYEFTPKEKSNLKNF